MNVGITFEKKNTKNAEACFSFSDLEIPAIALLCLHIYDGKHRDFISKRAAVVWCCWDMRAGVLFTRKKRSNNCIYFLLEFVPKGTRFSLGPIWSPLNLCLPKKNSGQHAARALCRVHCRWRVTCRGGRCFKFRWNCPDGFCLLGCPRNLGSMVSK